MLANLNEAVKYKGRKGKLSYQRFYVYSSRAVILALSDGFSLHHELMRALLTHGRFQWDMVDKILRHLVLVIQTSKLKIEMQNTRCGIKFQTNFRGKSISNIKSFCTGKETLAQYGS